MADKKISALTSASTPLAGTEVLPIVQSGATVKVSVENVLTSVQPSGVANSVVYLNGSKVATTGGVLLFDGTNLGVGTTPAYRADVVSPAGAQNIFRAGQSGVSNGLTISSDGANLSYQFDTGNIVIGTSGKGIDFSATSGSGTSELLADYEEGTWTPIDSSGAGLTFVAATGSYTKVGNLVSASGFVQFPVTASALGITIGGLPFTSANTANRGVGSLNYKQTVAAATLLLNNNATNMLVVTETGSVTLNSALSNAVLYFGVTYSI
jgi:hypothetical protein